MIDVAYGLWLYLISIFCSCSTLNCLSQKKKIKIIIIKIFLTLVQTLLKSFITNAPLRFFHESINFLLQRVVKVCHTVLYGLYNANDIHDYPRIIVDQRSVSRATSIFKNSQNT